MSTPTRELVKLVAADCFPGEDPGVVMEYLDLYGVESFERERERVQLGILRLSSGDVDKFIYFIEVAKKDYRDVLYWAESLPLK